MWELRMAVPKDGMLSKSHVRVDFVKTLVDIQRQTMACHLQYP